MSTFDGKILEISGISVDEFVDDQAKCYFLSHCHTDHMRGLRLLHTESPVYTTSISALLIRNKSPQLADKIRILELGVPTAVDLPGSSQNFVVTALSAGHCAGSCMLLFQIEGCDILYTGDFRISLKNANNIKLLKEIRNNSSTVLYLDSTFLKLSFPSFPSQSESVTTIVDIVEKFLRKSMNHKITLVVPARYGYEFLLMELSSKLKEKVFIHEAEVYEQYSMISRLEACVTTNEKRARIFLKPTFVTSSLKFDDKDVLKIQLSAMFWTNWKRGAPYVLKTGQRSYRVCYATHNSFNEIRDFLLFIKPKKVCLNFLPDNVEQKQKMFRQIEAIQKQYLGEEKKEEELKPKTKFTFKRLRTMSSRVEGESLKADKKLKSS